MALKLMTNTVIQTSKKPVFAHTHTNPYIKSTATVFLPKLLMAHVYLECWWLGKIQSIHFNSNGTDKQDLGTRS